MGLYTKHGEGVSLVPAAITKPFMDFFFLTDSSRQLDPVCLFLCNHSDVPCEINYDRTHPSAGSGIL